MNKLKRNRVVTLLAFTVFFSLGVLYSCAWPAGVEDCATDSECADGEICRNGGCGEGCRDDAGCSSGYICESDICVEGCRDDAGCSSGYICESDTCVEGCRQDSDCGSGFICEGLSCLSLWYYDSSSGLTWQNPPADSSMNWENAKNYCSNLNLDGHTDWRLPTISELRSLIRGCPGTVTGGACGVTDSCTDGYCDNSGGCTGCSFNAGPADGCYWPDEMEGTCSCYWSSSHVYKALHVCFYEGLVNDYGVDGGNYVRCVR